MNRNQIEKVTNLCFDLLRHPKEAEFKHGEDTFERLVNSIIQFKNAEGAFLVAELCIRRCSPSVPFKMYYILTKHIINMVKLLKVQGKNVYLEKAATLLMNTNDRKDFFSWQIELNVAVLSIYELNLTWEYLQKQLQHRTKAEPTISGLSYYINITYPILLNTLYNCNNTTIISKTVEILATCSILPLQQIVKNLKHNHWLVRRNTCILIGKLGIPELATRLQPLLQDENATIREVAVLALKEILGSDAAFLDTTPEKQSQFIRRQILHALKKVPKHKRISYRRLHLSSSSVM